MYEINMKREDIIYGFISALASYAIIYYSLYLLKNLYILKTGIGLGWNSLILVLMFWIMILTNPLVIKSSGFKKIFQKK